MHRTAVAGGLMMVALLCAAAHADVITTADLSAWSDDFADVSAWQARRDWLGNLGPGATVTGDGKVACFRVDGPGLGMKWSRSIRSVALSDAPYLFLRYRAERLKTEGDDYLIYVDDGVPTPECRPIRLRDAVADGRWRTVAVDMQRITRGQTASAVAVQVQAGPAGKARLWIDELGFADSPPPGASLLRAGPGDVTRADTSVDLSAAAWEPQMSWLANPAAKHDVLRPAAKGPTVFGVNEPGRGMKWYWRLDRQLDLTGHRYVAMRYRATHLRPYPDYALCFLGETRDGSTYEEVIHGTDLQPDGHWRTVVAPLRHAAARIPKAYGIAVQVQAGRAPAELQVDRIRLVATRPSTPLTDLISFQPGATFDGFTPIDLSGVCNQTLGPVLQSLRVTDWPGYAAITANGVPFRLQQGASVLAATGLSAKTQLTLPIDCRTSQLFVLMLAVLRGKEDPVYGGGAFRRIDDVDRFRMQLTYDDGTVEECLPGNVSTGRFEILAGPQVLCAFADTARTLRSVTVCDVTEHGGFAVAAVTCRTDGGPLFTQFDETRPPTPIKRWDEPPAPGKIAGMVGKGGQVTMFNNLLRIMVGTRTRRSPACVRHLTDKVARRDIIPPDRAEPLLAMTVDGWQVGQDQYSRVTQQTTLAGPGPKTVVYDVLPCPGLQVQIGLGLTDRGALRFRGQLMNRGKRAYRVGLVYPRIGPYVLGDDLADNEYVFPCRAAVIGRENTSLFMRYSGMFGVQFMATVNPSAGQGLYLRTEDTTCIERSYVLRKDAKGMFMAVSYPERSIAPGVTRPLVDTLIAVGDGDWHAALDDYRRWLKTWYRPASPRKRWFREVFNFRQRFLHWLDPLYEAKTGRIDLPRAVAEARERFGGIDYLHLFDWGNCGPHGRIYGRIGDYSPYDFIKGGQKNLHDAIAGVRKGGVPTGLYIEGYLLNERGKLGRTHGAEWQLRRADGSGARWPKSHEVYACAGVEAWRKVQAATYAAKVRELDVDGMYIDQYGFTGTDKDCYSAKHGHPVPSYTVRTELQTTRAIRRAIDAVKPGVAIYTEESPCDVTSQVQDGSFTYEMNQCHARRGTIPLNLFRFAVPDFKTFEILICDKPTASWAAGVRWTFFNGEGLWLEGPADEWFTPETLATIRKCHDILRRHRDAFTTDRPCPLVPTLAGGVVANRFPIERKELWTLYNTRHRTVRGEVLRVRHRPGWRWHDAWHGRTPAVRQDGPFDIVRTRIGPQGVGCLVRTAPR